MAKPLRPRPSLARRAPGGTLTTVSLTATASLATASLASATTSGSARSSLARRSLDEPVLRLGYHVTPKGARRAQRTPGRSLLSQ